jgi:hypothetical protein
VLPLAHDPLEVLLTCGFKQPGAVCLEVPYIQQPRFRRHEALELGLALDQRQRSQVAAVQPQQVKRVKESLSAASEEAVELRPAFRVQTDDLAVQDRRTARQGAF